jgi:energy-coupling factor transporter ATP-binding protein EcfA2
MKLRRAVIENFRGLSRLEIDFLEDSAAGERAPRALTCLVGDNGAGKTSVLQAIGLVLWLAAGRDRRVEEFAWEGFLPERMGTLGKTRVEVEVAFTDEEIELSNTIFEAWYKLDTSRSFLHWRLTGPKEIAALRVATAIFDDGAVSPSFSDGHCIPFLGRWAMEQIAKTHPDLAARRSELGAVTWFQQNRLPRSNVRADLVGWWAKHTSPVGHGRNGSDPVSRFNENLDRVFPGLEFVGVDEDPTAVSGAGPKSFYCLFERGGKPYDLAELSSGEQAVFPFAYEFALSAPGPSVVLIDELELHLHPPQQQALLAALPKLAPEAQFVITTHSPAIADMVPERRIVRLEGGRRCL